MKKKFAFTFITAISVIGAFAQPKIDFGIRAGLNISNVSASVKGDAEVFALEFHPEGEFKTKPGVNVGLFADMYLTEKLFIQPGLFYSLKGFKYSLDTETRSGSLFEADYTDNFHYLEVPVSLGLSFNLGNLTSIYFYTGPYAGIGLKTQANGTSKQVTSKHNSNTELGGTEFGEKYKRMDFGWNFGAGARFGRISAGVQYGLGLTDFASSELKEEFNKAEMRHRNISFNLGYYF